MAKQETYNNNENVAISVKEKVYAFPIFTKLQWFLISLLILFTILSVLALIDLFSGQHERTLSAMSHGQYAKISIIDGKITGNIPKSIDEALHKEPILAKISIEDIPDKPHAKSITHKKSIAHKNNKHNSTEDKVKEPHKETNNNTNDTNDIHNNININEHKKSNITQTHADTHIDNSTNYHENNKSIKNRDFMQPAPNPDMIEKHPKYGNLPRRDNNGEPPWAYYARPSSAKKNQPVIALVITGLGISELSSKEALELPADISFSFSPYDRDIINRTKTARNAGHEVWIDAPIQFADYPASDPGPLGLTKSASDDENHSRLLKLLGRDIGYVGLITPNNKTFSANKMMKNIHKELLERGLLLLLRSRKYNPVEGTENILYANREINRDDNPEYWQQTFSELEAISNSYGYAIGVLSPTPGIFKAFKKWHKQINTKKIALVPLSAIIGIKN